MTSADPRSALSHPAENMPVRLGTAEQFARVRRFFHDVGFNDGTVSSVLNIPDMSRAVGIGRETLDIASVSPALLAAIDLFVLGIAILSTIKTKSPTVASSGASLSTIGRKELSKNSTLSSA